MTRRSLIAGFALILPGAAQAQNVAEVQVAPPSITIRVGERSGLLATAFDRIGNVIPTVRIIWSSNNLRVAKVDNNGTVTGVGNGVAIIEARVGPRKGQAAVQVTGGVGPAPPAGPRPGGGSLHPPGGAPVAAAGYRTGGGNPTPGGGHQPPARALSTPAGGGDARAGPERARHLGPPEGGRD